jgi:hypothetical protein
LTPAEIVTALARHGTRVAVVGESVRLVFNAGSAPPCELIHAAREAKAALREIAGKHPCLAPDAASVAPCAFVKGLATLSPGRPPGGVPPKRWQQFIDDCGAFLDGGWAVKAAVLGWGPLDLFGCDRHRPWARIDQAGLLWLMAGRRLVALTANSATIETASGGRLTYRRASASRHSVPNDPGRVLAWSLCGGGDR